MKKKNIFVVCMILVVCLVLCGCDNDDRSNKEKEKDEIEKTEKDAGKEIKQEYTDELDDMSGLLSYVAYAVVYGKDSIINDSKISDGKITVDDNLVWNTMSYLFEFKDFEDKFQTKVEKIDNVNTPVVHIDNTKFQEILNEAFNIGKIIPMRKGESSIMKASDGYDFYLEGVEEKQASFDMVDILAIDIEKENFLLKVKLNINDEDKIIEVARGEINMTKNGSAEFFPYYIKSINLKKVGNGILNDTDNTKTDAIDSKNNINKKDTKIGNKDSVDKKDSKTDKKNSTKKDNKTDKKNSTNKNNKADKKNSTNKSNKKNNGKVNIANNSIKIDKNTVNNLKKKVNQNKNNVINKIKDKDYKNTINDVKKKIEKNKSNIVSSLKKNGVTVQ